MRWTVALLAVTAVAALSLHSGFAAEGADASGGARLFGACAPCHSLQPDVNMTGPSLHGVWDRKAGSLKSFDRYSPALKSSGVQWDAETLDAWLKDPAQLIPQNRMTFQGIPDSKARAALIDYLKVASVASRVAPTVQQGDMGGMMGGMAPQHPNLKKLELADQVKAIGYCRDTYHVTTGDGQTLDFWEPNIRFKTDSGELGPAKGIPALLGAGMMGDRVSIIFAAPGEISAFIKQQC